MNDGGRASLETPVAARRLRRRGVGLEAATLAWNVVGTVVVVVAAVGARSVALAGFGLDSLIEILASTVVIWQLTGGGVDRERTATRLIGWGFVALAIYVTAEAAYTLAAGHAPRHSTLGILWTAATAIVMFLLAGAKARTGTELGNPVLSTEARVTLIDALLALSILVGLVLNSTLGLWQADPLAGLVVVAYGLREARDALADRG